MTTFSRFRGDPGLGLGVTDHAVPSQGSMSVWPTVAHRSDVAG